ncbi:hypothetical protein [Cytobacillus kochii]|uniref:hypothetical protein n=1 Tax=Cytobacillus kochii TaxID=859143 RepID=UPI0025A2B2B2|nr:hypothetical protein [Cytobacillus kochii]MDM5209221.1 hypothetical protein [Cytobacillus kochii]
MNVLKITIPFLILIFGIVFENIFNENYEKWAKPILQYKIDLYIILLVAYFVYILFDNYKQNNDQKISSLDNEIIQYKDDLKEETKGLWKYYHDLSRFNQQEIVQKLMRTFVDNQKNVMAVQLYDYVFKEGSKKTSIKVTHQSGYVAEGEMMNALLQEHYTISSKLYKTYRNAITSIGKNNGIKVLNFINQYKIKLDNTSPEALQGKVIYSIQYSLVLLAVQSYIYFFTNERTYESFTTNILEEEDKEKILNDNKRTGVLRGILNKELVGGDTYIFFHVGDNNKKGRIYFTKGIKINGVKCVFLITLYNNLHESELLDKVNEISNSFEHLLLNSGINVEIN